MKGFYLVHFHTIKLHAYCTFMHAQRYMYDFYTLQKNNYVSVIS